jgi:phospholipid/cholesterol/gamma-HCH transport system substrate-binding protein
MTRIPVGPLVKFLVFAVITALATTVLGLTIANAQGGDRSSYSARFTDVSGLLPGDDVRIAGVVVGSIDDISIVDRRIAQVDFSVDSGLTLPFSTTASVLYKNLIGQRFLSLGQGDGAKGPNLEPGGQIPIERTTPPLNLTVLFNGFQPLFAALDPEQVNTLSTEIVQVLQGQGGTVQSLLTSTASLTSTIADRDQVIGQVIDNLNDVLDSVTSRDDQLNDLIVSLRQLVSGLSEDREPIGNAITSIGELTQVTSGLLEDGRPALKDDIAALGDLTDQLDQGAPAIEHFLQFAPYKLNKISRAASYGSWFQFYLCGASGSVGIGDLVPRQEIPVLHADVPRCGDDPSGADGRPSPLLPGAPQLPQLQAPTALPDLPVLGGN